MPSDLRKLLPVGVARDGRYIYGPYNDQGNLWQPCDVDICNGRMINGQYAYVTTTFFPYTVGCWGPGVSSNMQPPCTNNPRVCTLKRVSSATLLSAAAAALSVTLLIL